MKLSLQKATETINIEYRALQNYLENTDIHTKEEIDSYIIKEGKNKKRFLTRKGYDKAFKHFGARLEVVDNESEMYLKSMVQSLQQDKVNMNEQIRLISSNFETTKLLSDNAIQENESLKSENKAQLKLVHEKDLLIQDLKHQLELQNNKSLFQRIFKK